MHLELKWYFSWNQKFEKTKQIKKFVKLIEFIIYTWNGIGLPSSPCIKWCFSSSWTNSLGWSRFSLSLTQPEIVYFSWIIQWGLGVKFFSWKKKCLPVGADTSLLEASMLFMVVSCKRSRPEMLEAICALLFFLL